MTTRRTPPTTHARPLRSGLVALACLLLGAEVALAREASLVVEGEAVYDDNVFSTSGEKDDDVIFRVTPQMRVQERKGTFQWLLEYSPSYNYYATFSDLDGFDHDVFGEFTWRITPRTRLTASDRFRRYGAETRFNESSDVAAGDDPEDTRAEQRARVVANFASIGLSHRFTPRNTTSLQAFHQLVDRQDDDGSDTEGYGLSLQHFYIFNERLQAGPRLNWTRRTQKPRVGRDTSTDFVSLSGRFQYEISPGFTMDVSAGPALVISEDGTNLPSTISPQRIPGGGLVDVTTCPTLDNGTPFLGGGCEMLDLFANETIQTDGATVPGTVQALVEPGFGEVTAFTTAASQGEVTLPLLDAPSGGGTELTYFIDVSIQKQWKNWRFSIGYRRSDDSSASNFGVTAVTDRVFGSINWQATEKLQVSFSGSWVDQNQEQDLYFPVAGLSNTSLVIDSRSTLFGIIPVGRQVTFGNVAEATSYEALSFDSDSRTETINVALSARYRLRKRLTLLSGVTYRHQEESGRLSSGTTLDHFLARVGLEYAFEPWRF